MIATSSLQRSPDPLTGLRGLLLRKEKGMEGTEGKGKERWKEKVRGTAP